MSAIDLSDDQLNEVHTFWQRTDPSREFQVKLDDLMEDLPQSMQLKIVSNMFKRTLNENHVIKNFLNQRFIQSN
jgi:hypothetical protein